MEVDELSRRQIGRTYIASSRQVNKQYSFLAIPNVNES